MQVQELVGIIPWIFVCTDLQLFYSDVSDQTILGSNRYSLRYWKTRPRGCRCGNHTGRGDKRKVEAIRRI